MQSALGAQAVQAHPISLRSFTAPQRAGRSQFAGFQGLKAFPRSTSSSSSSSSRRARPAAPVAGFLGGGSKESWWTKDAPPNMVHIKSVQHLVDELQAAGDDLVIVDFFAPWCAACKALYPRLAGLARDHEGVRFLAVNFDENKALCRGLGVKVLPFFQVYRGANGRLASFSASVSKLQRIQDAIAEHGTPRCQLGSPPLLEEFPSVLPRTSAGGGGARPPAAREMEPVA